MDEVVVSCFHSASIYPHWFVHTLQKQKTGRQGLCKWDQGIKSLSTEAARRKLVRLF